MLHDKLGHSESRDNLHNRQRLHTGQLFMPTIRHKVEQDQLCLSRFRQGHSEGVGGGCSRQTCPRAKGSLIIVVFIPGRIEATAEGETKDIKF